MIGISWGGFNSIQMAMRNPPALKAIVAVDATEDLYQDDVHFIDGMMHVDSWEMSHGPGQRDPGRAGLRDRRRISSRSASTGRRGCSPTRSSSGTGPFWDRASLRSRYDVDPDPDLPHRRLVRRLPRQHPAHARALKAPVRAIVGAWNHCWPHEPYPKPGIEWRHEAVRLFDQSLKGRNTGILEEPRLAVYVRSGIRRGRISRRRPASGATRTAGRSRASQDDALPATRPHARREAGRGGEHRLRTCRHRHRGGRPVMWFGDVAADQRPTDAFSLVYDRRRSNGRREILGPPERAPAGRRRRAARELVRRRLGRRARRRASRSSPARASTARTASRRASRRRSSRESSCPWTSRCISRPGCFPRATACASPSATPSGR